MSPPEIHLSLLHFPIVGALVGIVLVIVSIYRKDEKLQRAGMLAFVLAALFAFPVYFSGEPTEEIVERLAGVEHDAIEAHEEAARWAFISLEMLGALGLFGLMGYRGRSLPRWYGPALAAVGVIVTGWLLWTANLGGRVSHPEIRPGFTAPVEPADGHAEEGGHEEDDDDG